MFYTFFLIVLLLVALVLVIAILLQAGKGGGLAANFGGASSSADALLGSRQASNILTKISWWAGGIFLGLSFILSLSSGGPQAPSSVLDQLGNDGQTQQQTAPAPSTAAPPTLPLKTDTGTPPATGATKGNPPPGGKSPQF